MGEFVKRFKRLAAPKEQPPPESLRPRDRARLTVWKELRRKPEPPKGQSSQAQRQTGAEAERRVCCATVAEAIE